MKKIIHWMLSAAIRPLVLTMVFCGSTDKADAAWYTINGVKLEGKPSVKGVYVNNGRKVIIK